LILDKSYFTFEILKSNTFYYGRISDSVVITEKSDIASSSIFEIDPIPSLFKFSAVNKLLSLPKSLERV
jgi:hypothetical protein